MTCNSCSSNGARECTHLPDRILELPCVLCHPSLPNSLSFTAKLLSTSKAVAAAARAARSSQLPELALAMASSSEAQQVAAWMTRNRDMLQGVHTLQLQLDRKAIDRHSRTAGFSIWRLLTCRSAAIFENSTNSAAVAASWRYPVSSAIPPCPLHWA